MDTALAVLVELFVSAKKTEGRTPKTTSWYKNMLARLVAFVGECKIGALSVGDASRFIADLQARTVRYVNHPVSPEKRGALTPHTISCYVRTLKVFSRWLCDEGFAKEDLFFRLKRPKLPELVIEVLSNQEIAKLVDCINPNTFHFR